MSVDKKSSVLNLIDLLSIPPDERSEHCIENIAKATGNFKFFQDIIENDETASLHLECCKVLTLSWYKQGDYVCRKGDPGTHFYLILRGFVRILAPLEMPVSKTDDQDLARIVRRNTDLEETYKQFRHQFTSLGFNAGEVEEKEVAVLNHGQSFGEMALLNDKPRFFSVQCGEPTALGILHKNDYNLISKVHEKQLADKVAFLKSLDVFRSWSTIALQKLSYFFRVIPLNKGNVVYYEGDEPVEIYFIKSGEFVFTQDYEIDAGYKNSIDILGSLKKTKQETVIRKKKLKMVVKQQGEIFGYNEIYESKQKRDFTCTCQSLTGELIAITDKNFAKKIIHPDTLRQIEESCISFRDWVKVRLESLKHIERFKDNLSFTPFSKIKTNPRPREVSLDIKLPSLYTPVPVKATLPIILDKLLVKSRNESNTNRKHDDSSSRLFYTEINQSMYHSRGRRKISVKKFDSSFSYSSVSPTRLLPTTVRKL